MATTLHCDIVSAEKSIFSGSVEMIVATGVLGDLGIVPGHAALLTQLIPGPVKLTMEGGTRRLAEQKCNALFHTRIGICHP